MKTSVVMKILYYSTLVLILLPPLSLGIISTHLLAKISIGILSLYLIKTGFTIPKHLKTLSILLLLFFISQSLSVISVVNFPAFIVRYQNVIAGVLLGYVSMGMIDTQKTIDRIVNLLFSVVIFNLLFQTALYLWRDSLALLLQPILNSSFANLLIFNIRRDRLYIESYDELFIPLALTILIQGKKYWIGIIIVGISLIAFLSNTRTRLLMATVGIVSGFIILRQRLQLVVVAGVLLVLFFFVDAALLSHSSYSLFDRLTDSPDWRIEQWQRAVEIGSRNPLTGVCLGNYYDYFGTEVQDINNRELENFDIVAPNSEEFVHNIVFGTFAESGVLGLISLLSLLGYCLYWDIQRYKNGDMFALAFSAGFWILIVYALLNPSNTFRFLSLFVLIRVLAAQAMLLERSHRKTSKRSISRL